MQLEKLAMVNFRNYEKAEVNVASKIILICGLNAQGKTNFLEAIYLLCLGKSFRQAKNQDLLKIGSPHFTIEGHFKFDNQLDKVVALQYVMDGKKEVSVDRKRLPGYADVFGTFPAVVISPEDYRITTGGPAERRRFIDILLSQISFSYLSNLQEYQRVLKQRNKILQDIKSGLRITEATLEPWTVKLVEIGSKIIDERVRQLKDFVETLVPIYKKYSGSRDELALAIETQVSLHEIEESYRAALKKLSSKEKILGRSLVGPHRDDLLITINGRDIRVYGSRGEHKSAVIAFKLAELQFIKKKKEETPIVLLDDCFSELDDVREKEVFFSLQGLGQMFITTPREKNFFETKSAGEVTKYVVENGHIRSL